jgi:hypothetical protein
MDRQTQVPVQQYLQRMQAEVDRAMRQVIEAVNAAPDGRWINGSELAVRDVMAEFRRKAFETALQMRVDAAEGAFSPGGPGDNAKEAEQGARSALDADDQRPGCNAASALSQRVRRQPHAKRRPAGRHA